MLEAFYSKQAEASDFHIHTLSFCLWLIHSPGPVPQAPRGPWSDLFALFLSAFWTAARPLVASFPSLGLWGPQHESQDPGGWGLTKPSSWVQSIVSLKWKVRVNTHATPPLLTRLQVSPLSFSRNECNTTHLAEFYKNPFWNLIFGIGGFHLCVQNYYNYCLIIMAVFLICYNQDS